MPTYAVLNGGVVSERVIDDFDAYPAHKKSAKDERGDGYPVLRPISGPMSTPEHDQLTHIASMSYDIAPDSVTRIWQVTPRPATVDSVKAEAQRRIIVATGAADIMGCFVKQLNAQMRAAELINKKADGGSLTEAETAEAAALQALADAIKAIRSASNTIEASPPETVAALLVDPRWP